MYKFLAIRDWVVLAMMALCGSICMMAMMAVMGSAIALSIGSRVSNETAINLIKLASWFVFPGALYGYFIAKDMDRMVVRKFEAIHGYKITS